MKQIEKLVGTANSANPPLTLWFNPWMFQGSDNPVLPLLNTLVDKFEIRSKVKEVTEEPMDATYKCCVGVDVSKASLDYAMRPGGGEACG